MPEHCMYCGSQTYCDCRTDLFGQPVRRLKGDGYAGSPGAGPAGETCKSCAFLRRTGSSARAYLKCGHQLGRVSHGAATDIRASAPACEYWQSIAEPQEASR
jgi:hypothetical protein